MYHCWQIGENINNIYVCIILNNKIIKVIQALYIFTNDENDTFTENYNYIHEIKHFVELSSRKGHNFYEFKFNSKFKSSKFVIYLLHLYICAIIVPIVNIS